MRARILLYAWLQSAMVVFTSCQSFPTVNTPSGPIKGIVVPTLGKDIVQFRNIPYAKPPVGDLRFEKTLPVEPWTQTLDGTAFGPSCIQDTTFLEAMWENAENTKISEDCLQLNIYVPGSVSTEDKKSVMVWIHGGGFILGSSWENDASYLAMKDVIVVTINYRLGLFGFLSTEDTARPSNFGLWDMIEALKWVNKNIASFGGDPESVTIFGESSGGFAVSYLAVIPSTSGLFKRIIPQSGSAVAFMGIASNPASVAKDIGKLVGCINDEDTNIDNSDLVDCLKKKTPEELVTKQNPGDQQLDTFSFSPVIWPVNDGELLRWSPLESLKDSKSEESIYFRSLDMLAGTTDNEGNLLSFILSGLQEPMEFNLTQGMPTSVLYSSDDLEQQAKNIAILYEDAWFVAPTVQLLDFHAKDKISPNTYQYLFTQALNFPTLIPEYPWMEGAGHTAELAYLFGPKGMNAMEESVSSDKERAFTDVLVTYWTNFAKTGNPNGDGLVPWKAFSSKDRDYLELKYQPVPGKNLFEKRMKFLLEDIPNKIKNNVKTEL